MTVKTHQSLDKKFINFLAFIGLLFGFTEIFSAELMLSEKWDSLKPVLISRMNQKSLKMKLQEAEAINLVDFINDMQEPAPNLQGLQKILPKTILELLRAIYERNLPYLEAEKMAQYLDRLVERFQFQNVGTFDENTSHIIGREWQEIDYSGEGMSWQKQRQKYLPYGVSNFKSLRSLSKFFPIESKLPYFKIYKAKNPNAALKFEQ